MSNKLTSIRAKIKPYYIPSRRRVKLRVLLNSELADFQTEINCSPNEFKNNPELHVQIDDQINILANCITKFSSTDIVRNEYNKVRNGNSRKNLPELHCFYEVIEEFINVYTDTLSYGHLRMFGIMKRSLQHYATKPSLPCELLTSKFINQYTYYLVAKGVENSTIKGYLKRMKRVVRYGNDHLNIQFNIQFDLINQLKDKLNFVVFLNREEVEQFAKVVAKTPGEEEVKNGFLFRCYTGIRFSEMPYLDVNNLDDGVLSFYIPKTSKSHQIPLNRKALELLKKVKRFNPISQQKENQYIKILAKRAKIDRPVQRIKLSGSVSTVETFPKWKLCSSHTARRTWARIAYDAGVDILKISRYIGHSDISTTLKYIGHKDTDFDELKNLF
jgi:integrase